MEEKSSVSFNSLTVWNGTELVIIDHLSISIALK